MPTYEYICKKCDHEFEEFQSMSAPTLRKCPSCGKLSLERKIGVGAGIIFKGGGFYETDYRSDSYKKAAEADSKTASGASESSGHEHSGTCGCGKKPADQCPSTAKPDKVESTPSKTAAKKSAPKPAPQRRKASKA